MVKPGAMDIANGLTKSVWQKDQVINYILIFWRCSSCDVRQDNSLDGFIQQMPQFALVKKILSWVFSFFCD